MNVLDSGIERPYHVIFSTRQGGVSEGRFRSLNLGLLTQDEPERVRENRRRLCGAVDADPARLAMVWQQHGSEVSEAAPTGIAPDAAHLDQCDGVWSEQRGQAMSLLTADCLPVALYRAAGPPGLGLLHVGWRGLLAGIVEAGVAALGAEGQLEAVVGPGIGPCCYEVGDDVARPYRAAFGDEILVKSHLDLWAATERTLLRAGCTSVRRLDLCTSCNPELFFSHRRDKGRTGRQGVIGLVE